ncbi:hypothetical protein OIU85_018696 [Salix viminalis]|uniref:Uncharacterized protein n=1 Tax=Salix viminalis TaxID=40686 RepID=A0A9Q0UUA5_SALVM|nr:hypothetical protein OIU85_018696 [Salix viminalis]
MDDAFIDSLIRQQRLGNRVGSVFTTAAKDNMECCDMFHGANGFVWSPENKMWAAKPRTWKSFVKAKPKAKMDDYSNWPSLTSCHFFLQKIEPSQMSASNSQPNSQGCSHSATSLKGQKRKASSVDAIERQLKSIKDGIKQVARAIREGNLIAERGRPHVYSEQEVFSELVRIGVETHLRYKAYTSKM